MARTGTKMYKFIADCNRKHCKEVRTHMKGLGFDVTVKTIAWTGDHYGVIGLRSDAQAKRMGAQLYDKYSKSKKLYGVTIEKMGR